MFNKLRQNTETFYDYLIVAAFGVVMFISKLGEGGLRSDNVLYAAISKGVLTSDNPLILRLGNEIYLNKPPLFFWLNALFMKIFGFGIFGAKIANSLAAILIAIVLFKMAVKMFKSVNAGYAAVLFFATNVLIYKNSHACRLESLLVLTFLLGIYFAGKYTENKRTMDMVFSGIFFGLSVLVKGYIGGLAYVMVLLFLIITHKKYNGIRLTKDIFIGMIVFLAVFSWWFAYAFMHTDFFNVFVMNESVNRLEGMSDTWGSVPIYAYLQSFLTSSILMLPFIYIGLRRNFQMMRQNSTFIMYGMLSITYIIIIHFLATRYSRYLYTVIPFFALIAAGGFVSVFRFNLKPYIFGLTVVAALALSSYSGKTGDEGFNIIKDAYKIAKTNGGELCVEPSFLEKFEYQPAMLYFADSYKTGSCAENDLRIIESSDDCSSYQLFATKKIKVCIEGH
jgi:4-amino-4-deoxy-L-arabinose transferase-like glycosyltransferase